MTEQDKAHDFLQEHSLNFLEMAFRTDRQGALTHPDGNGKKTGDCGDTVEFFFSVWNEKIKEVSFVVNGCLNTNACANTVAQLVEGKNVESAWDITPEQVSDYLQTLPENHFHCAELAVGAFYLALAHYQQLKREPWKKVYS
jgi:nitrogen fixation protein NifU and related proteins